MGEMVCASCGHCGEPNRATRGHFAVELALWLCFLVPGLIYSIWRISSRYDVCASCGGRQLIPPDSPVGKQILESQPAAPKSPGGIARPPSPVAVSAGKSLGRLVSKAALWLVVVLIGIPLLVTVFVSFSAFQSFQEKKSPPNKAAPVPVQPMPPAAPPREIQQTWKYEVLEDPMSGKKAYLASVRSSNEEAFGFPYGKVRAILSLRRHPKHGKDVIFAVTAGHMLCYSYKDCQILVRFDDGEAREYSALGPSDGSSTVAFISGYDRFTEKLRKAKVVKVQAPFYQHGGVVFSFDVDGLDLGRLTGKDQ